MFVIRYCSANGGIGNNKPFTTSVVTATNVVPVAFFISVSLKAFIQYNIKYFETAPKGLIEANPLPIQIFLSVRFTSPTGALTHSYIELGFAILVSALVY